MYKLVSIFVHIASMLISPVLVLFKLYLNKYVDKTKFKKA